MSKNPQNSFNDWYFSHAGTYRMSSFHLLMIQVREENKNGFKYWSWAIYRRASSFNRDSLIHGATGESPTLHQAKSQAMKRASYIINMDQENLSRLMVKQSEECDNEKQREHERQQALSKLTDQERKILGV